jgi:DNA-binding response OmpR family regulator
MLFFLGAPDKELSNLHEQLKTRNYEISKFDNLFEFKRRLSKEQPDLVLVADNMKEKNIVDLLNAIQAIKGMVKVPIIGLVTNDDDHASIAYLQNGAADCIKSPFNIEELIVRIHLRIQESELKQHFTSVNFFWNEAQEKEQGKRTGVFKFYDDQNTEVGNISIKDGRMVFATYGSLIKEDAFLQLACNENLKFAFSDLENVSRTNINEGITNLLMEAAKLKDEIKKQESNISEELKVLVIDENRIARILASRSLKNMGYECKVTSPDEMTVRFMANFAPQLLVLDYQDAPKILDMLWPNPRTEADIPVIIYCDDDIKDINFNQIRDHAITNTVYKKNFHEEINTILQKVQSKEV